MPNYGFKAYGYTSEIYFSQFNNQYMLNAPVSQTITFVREIDMGIPYDQQYVEFVLPAWVIRYFKQNDLKFSFIPLAGYAADRNKCLYTGMINYQALYREIDNWNWQSDIRFRVYIRPRNLTVYARIIRRMSDRDDRNNSARINMSVLVGFR